MNQLTTIFTTLSLQVSNNKGLTYDISQYAKHITITKSLAQWFTQVSIDLTIPQELFISLLPFNECKFNLILQLIKNSQNLDQFRFKGITFVVNLDNTLDKSDPVNMTVILVPNMYLDLVQSFDFYFEGQTSTSTIIETIKSKIPYVSEFHPPQQNKAFYDAFIPSMSLIRCLAYACREFCYSDDVYHGFIDADGFRLIQWNHYKTTKRGFKLKLYPDSYSASVGFVKRMDYIERVDLQRRIPNSLNVVVQQPVNLEANPFLTSPSSKNYPAKSCQDKALLASINDCKLLKVDMTPDKKLFLLDLLYPVDVDTSINEFTPLRGLYMVTDVEIDVDLRQQENSPTLHVIMTKKED